MIGSTVYTLDQYQKAAGRTAIYPSRTDVEGLAYVTLGLTGEAGELANQVKKIMRDDEGHITGSRHRELFMELGDVLWYVAMVASELGVDLEEVARANLDKLSDRQSSGTLRGSGDER